MNNGGISMLILKMVSHLATAVVAFSIGTVIVAGIHRTIPLISEMPDKQLPAAKTVVSNFSGIYFVAPSNKQCLDGGQIRLDGPDSFLNTHQMPATKRIIRDGHWFILETETVDDTSYEFHGVAWTGSSTVVGTASRITKGTIIDSTNATYYNPGCFQTR